MNTDFRLVDLNMIVFKQKTYLISPGGHFTPKTRTAYFNGIHVSFVICF